MRIEEKMNELGIPLHKPTGSLNMRRVFPFVRVSGNRAWISGHAATNPDGTMYSKQFGKVGSELTKDEAYEVARLTGLSIIADLKEELGDLDRVKRWVRVFGMVNVASGFNEMPYVINGFSDLILELWGEEEGRHARSAVGMAELPFGISVEIEAEIELTS